MRPPPPCRLFVIVARKAPIAVILRRGPTRWVQVITWHMAENKFEDGAWFHGRIYEGKCDLSPDGSLFLYFAAKHQREPMNDDYGYAWTAVSRPPWLHALALWPSQSGTYGGGGVFVTNDEAVISADVATYHPAHPPHGLKVCSGTNYAIVGERPVCDADWSGRDHQGRIIFSRDGKMFRRSERAGRTFDRELADFNGRVPKPRPAPAAAQRPLAGHRRLPRQTNLKTKQRKKS